MKIDYTKVLKSNSNIDLNLIEKEAYAARKTLLDKTGPGKELTGWVEYPNTIKEEDFIKLEEYAKDIKSKAKILVVVGIGGSYLGTKAVIEMLKGYFKNKSELKIMFAGYTLSATYMKELIMYLEDKDFCINYVSKSGNTTEPAIAFRMLKDLLKEKYGKKYNDRIYVTTDGFSGNALKQAKKHKYHLLTIPSNIGGRYSIFTDGTLFPLCCVDIDIRNFIKGAKDAIFDCEQKSFSNNIALQYAAFRNLNYRNKKEIEILCVYSPRMLSISEWWEQLFAESEGKDGKGLFPTSLVYSTALHSVGQYVQDGSRILFETIINVEKSRYDLKFPFDEDNDDELNYLNEFTLHEINAKMLQATILAHAKGGTPNLVLEMENLDTYNLGYLMYTLMFSCAVSSYILKVNPFDQPAVQEYKDNMYALLGKPGYEKLKEELQKKL